MGKSKHSKKKKNSIFLFHQIQNGLANNFHCFLQKEPINVFQDKKTGIVFKINGIY